MLLEDFCGGFQEAAEREAVLRVCEHEGAGAEGAKLLVEKGCVGAETLFPGVHGVLG